MEQNIVQQSCLEGLVGNHEVSPKHSPVGQTLNCQESARERHLRLRREWRLRHRKPDTRPIRPPHQPATKDFIKMNCAVDAVTGCWLWKRAIGKNGRGVMRVGKRSAVTVSRVVWELWYGLIPSGLCVCHHCDNPRCCNPIHLFLGTYKDNKRDCIAKGRAYPIWDYWKK